MGLRLFVLAGCSWYSAQAVWKDHSQVLGASFDFAGTRCCPGCMEYVLHLIARPLLAVCWCLLGALAVWSSVGGECGDD